MIIFWKFPEKNFYNKKKYNYYKTNSEVNLKKHLRRFNLVATTVIVGLLPSIALISCTNSVIKNDDWSLKQFQSLLWQTTADRRAGFITQFAHAQHQFDAIITNEENQKFLSRDIVKVEKDISGDYKVEYQPKEGKYVPAVMVDLDETMIDNTPYQVFLGLTRQYFSPETWHSWVTAQKAKIYDGVLKFVKHVWESGGMVFITSNRNQGDLGGNKIGDELIPTRQNLINQNYPKAFLDPHVWWMLGSTQSGENQSDENLVKMRSKEQRYNYLNNLNTKISSQDWQEIGINDAEEKNQRKIRKFDNIQVQTVMRIGDDLNDFNENVTKNLDLSMKHKYLDNENIRGLFGHSAPRISFFKEQDKIREVYYDQNLKAKIDQNLKIAKIVDEIIFEDLKFNPQETYAFIAGNPMYGGWTDKYAYDFETIERALSEYWKSAKW